MNQDNLEQRIQQSLLSSVDALDMETKRSLQTIRNNALKQKTKSSWFNATWLLPAAGLAFCSIFAVMLYFPSQASNPSATSIDQTAMLELIGNSDDIDTLSDPDFYMWLDETTGT